MPDAEGRLSKEEMLRAADWANNHDDGKHVCSLCGATKFFVAEHLVNLHIYRPGITISGGASYPQFQLICLNCGTTQLINATFTGLLNKDLTENETATGSDHAEGGA